MDHLGEVQEARVRAAGAVDALLHALARALECVLRFGDGHVERRGDRGEHRGAAGVFTGAACVEGVVEIGEDDALVREAHGIPSFVGADCVRRRALIA
jgi:hypothetical protein